MRIGGGVVCVPTHMSYMYKVFMVVVAESIVDPAFFWYWKNTDGSGQEVDEEQ